MSETRKRIARHVHAHPGVHFSGLVRTLDLAPGQVQYHLKRLLSAEDLVDEQLYGQTHYYPLDCDEWERGALALLCRETASDVVTVLAEHGTARPQRVADELDIARSTLEWHLDHLVEQAVVAKRRDERNHVTLALVRPKETTQLLDETDPSTPARLVDRFTRVADRLLDDP
ncbi:winged helix-turn-helix transcriptional regulator [Halococcus agarilyticus]|uniref:winged helix-turn-helix transcriptional regulator n=1 Tax=Halococcus agarilyticus TaxID=1232219 RepID=UPI000677F381|nr:transcriptional regulator [Halococcus agarilyticus]